MKCGIKRVLAGGLALLLATVGVANASAKAANVLFIAVDDLKPWLGCYGHPVIKSPNMDRIAEQGAVFLDNYSQIALCGPSRMSVLTGMRPDSLRIYSMGAEKQYHIDGARKRLPDMRTLPELFKANGYTSLGHGKVFDSRNTNSGQDPQSWSNRKGVQWIFDTSLYPVAPVRGGYQSDELRALRETAMAEAKKLGYTKKKQIINYLSGVDGARPVTECLDLPDEAYAEGNHMVVPALQEIERFGKSGEPFFLAVGFYKPHLPFVAPKKYWDLYTPDQFEVDPMPAYPTGGVAVAETDYNEGRGFHPVPDEGPISPELQRHMLHGYAACVSYVDAQVGKLLKALDDAGLSENTVICLWGDHGFHLGDKQIWGKHTNYEQATRAPLIISAPSMPKGTVVKGAMTEHIDLYPTLCELTGVEATKGLEGQSLVPLMKGEIPKNARVAVSQYLRAEKKGEKVMGWAIRTPRYRYVEWRRVSFDGEEYSFSGEVVGQELYDYQKDPHETLNCANLPEYAQTLKQLTKEFDQALSYLPERN